MNIRLIMIVLLGIAWVAGTPAATAQDKAGTSAAPELLIPLGAKEVAVSGASLSSVNGVHAIYWNPAGLDFEAGTSALFAYRSYIGDIGVNYLALGTQFSGLGSLGLTLRTFSFGDIDVTTEDRTDGTGEVFSPTFFTLGLTYSRQLTDNVGIGVTMNIVNESFARVSASGIAADVGVQYRNLGGVDGLSIGVCVKNIGTAMQYGGSGLWVAAEDPTSHRGLTQYKVEAASYQMPSTIQIGMGYKMKLADQSGLQFSAAFENDNYGIDKYRVGAEISFMRSLFVRGGYIYSTDMYGTKSIFQNTTVGIGIDLFEYAGIPLGIDYAFVPVQYFDANHLIDIHLQF
ncbi:MAG: PorV/PorQ family protein [Ignavibacteriae bacterium]|nr:MAG: PorV/PorQ family protein [Ignavibacteriota bacterium]